MVSRRTAYRPPATPEIPRHPEKVYWIRRTIVIVALGVVALFGYYAITLVVALTNPSYGTSLSARAAEWGRGHGFGAVVTWIEAEAYRLNPPKVGGTPSISSFGSGPTAVKVPTGGHLPAPKNLVSPAKHPLPGEGVWHVAGRETANGVPTVYEAFVRPDAVHTSYVVGVAWMDPTLLKAQLYSGSYIPGGGPYKYTAPISASASTTLVAAFNAGFRIQDSNGGYYTDGKNIKPLVNNAASVVIYKDGTMTLGAWGTQVWMSNQVASVRQNLDLIVNDGKAAKGLENQNSDKWGKTLGGSFNVWRSGLGVTKDGAIIYVGGPALSISDLANVLVRAGAVRGMQLDINTGWVQYSTFRGPLGTSLNGANASALLNSMPNGSRYFTTWWNRDFFTMSLRSNELVKSTTTTTAAG
jgi:hypothetical protein